MTRHEPADAHPVEAGSRPRVHAARARTYLGALLCGLDVGVVLGAQLPGTSVPHPPHKASERPDVLQVRTGADRSAHGDRVGRR